jgi:hypothetical protein
MVVREGIETMYCTVLYVQYSFGCRKRGKEGELKSGGERCSAMQKQTATFEVAFISGCVHKLHCIAARGTKIESQYKLWLASAINLHGSSADHYSPAQRGGREREIHPEALRSSD